MLGDRWAGQRWRGLARAAVCADKTKLGSWLRWPGCARLARLAWRLTASLLFSMNRHCVWRRLRTTCCCSGIRRLRVALATRSAWPSWRRKLARLGPPADLGEAVARYSLLVRLPEVVRVEHQLRVGPSWLRFELRATGGSPGAAMRALARVSATPVTSRRRDWWKEIGFPTCAEGTIEELFRACPLLEAMDPLRLHPPLSWRRILPALRFPALGRVVAGRVLELGIESAGSALVMALLRFGSAGEADADPGSAQEIAFAIRFLAHVCWLHILFAGGRSLASGSDFAALLAAAADVDPRLLWPPDVVRDSGLGREFTQTLQRLRAEIPAPERYRALRALCVLATNF